MKFETIAQLEAHLELNYSDTVYSIPEYDEEKSLITVSVDNTVRVSSYK